jgi:hypothetical protein
VGPPGTPVVRPRGWWYLVPAALAVFACVACVAAVRQGFQDAEDVATQASTAAPGVEQTLTIADPAGYTVAYYGPIIVSSTDQRDALIEDLEISILPADGGEALPLRPYEGLNDLTAEGQQYVPLLTVRFEQPGDYVLRSSPTAGVDRERAGVAVSESPYRKLRSGAERAVVILAVGLALAILVTVILARTRGRAKERVRAQLPPPAPWPPSGAWGGPPAGGWGPPGWPPR